jgi:hypothetical protein
VLVDLDTTFATTVWLDPVATPVTPAETTGLEDLTPGGRVVDHREQRVPGTAVVIYPDDADPWVLVVRHEVNATPPARLIVAPDSRELVVFEGGDGRCFAVAIEDGAVTRILGLETLRQVRTFRDPELLILAEEFRTVVAFGRDGFLWETAQGILDELELGERDGDRLAARGYGYFGRVEFAIDLATGATRDLRYIEAPT